MKPPQRLQIELLSDATFSRGDPPSEVEHDGSGLPFLHGKRLHGLLRDAWRTMARAFGDLEEPARRVFGVAGDLSDAALLRVGDAVLPADFRAWVRYAVHRRDDPLQPEQVLRTLTDVRHQVAFNRATGTADPTTRRSTRVILRGLRFAAPLTWLVPPEPVHIQVLALSALGVRHAGFGRSRGRGHLVLSLDGDVDSTQKFATGAGGAT